MQRHGIPFHTIPPALFIAYQIILDIFNPDEHVHGGLTINWLVAQALPDDVLDLELSRRLLFYIGRTTELARSKDTTVPEEGTVLLRLIQETDQVVSGVEDEAKRLCPGETQQAFVLPQPSFWLCWQSSAWVSRCECLALICSTWDVPSEL